MFLVFWYLSPKCIHGGEKKIGELFVGRREDNSLFHKHSIFTVYL